MKENMTLQCEGMPLISVIVPIYNTEAYLKECVDSILEQTYQNLEIILVDDESTDASGKICDDYAKQDSRVHVIHQKNQGQGVARNTGLDMAKGEWIGFADSDDWLEPNMFEMLLRYAFETKADIVNCRYWRHWKNLTKVKDDDGKVIILDGCEAMLHSAEARIGVEVWSKLYHRSFWDAGVRFKVVKKYEDVDIIYAIYLQCRRLTCINVPLYHYRQRKNSTVHVVNMNYMMDRWDGRKSGFDIMKNKVHKDLWNLFFMDCFNVAYDAWSLAAVESRKSRREFHAQYEDISCFFREYANDIKQARLSGFVKFYCSLLKHNNYMTYLIIHMIDHAHKVLKIDKNSNKHKKDRILYD